MCLKCYWTNDIVIYKIKASRETKHRTADGQESLSVWLQQIHDISGKKKKKRKKEKSDIFQKMTDFFKN